MSFFLLNPAIRSLIMNYKWRSELWRTLSNSFFLVLKTFRPLKNLQLSFSYNMILLVIYLFLIVDPLFFVVLGFNEDVGAEVRILRSPSEFSFE